METTIPPPTFPAISELRTVMLCSESDGRFGSKSIPACGLVPAVPINSQLSMSRSRAFTTLIAWLQLDAFRFSETDSKQIENASLSYR